MKSLFYISLFTLFYAYLGYGILVYVLVKVNRLFVKKKSLMLKADLPTLSLIIAAYNEEEILIEKVNNCFQLHYPESKLEIIFITDGSTDNSESLLNIFPKIKLLSLPDRRGKTAALNRAVGFAKNDILIFSDANTMLNADALLEIAKKYADPRVGGVAGEKKVMKAGFLQADEGEGLYWRYESALKGLDAALYTVVGAAGELFSIRRKLYEQLDEKIILDDFVLSMRITMKGFRVEYASRAYAMELPSQSLHEEMKRKIRISAGAFQAIGLLYPLFNLFRYPVVAFQYLSHRVLRWAVCPVCLILLLVSNLFLLTFPLFKIVFGLQLLFYTSALAGWMLVKNKQKAGILYVPYYFGIMNYALVAGFFRFLRKNQSAVWEKSKRVTT